MTTAGTRLVCLLGHPVAHSLSPELHTAAFAAAGVDAVYVACDVPPGRMPEAVTALRSLSVLGANVTVPHKRAAWDLADVRTPEAELVGAANTLYWDGARLAADNTDAVALGQVLRNDVGLGRGDAVTLFGAGGAARAAAVALGRLGALVRVEARRPEHATEVQRLAERAGAVPAGGERPRLVVNATPLGLHGEPLPDRYMALGADQAALDLVYGAADTPFLAAARSTGAQALDGLGMLVGQAALAFERWTGLDAPVEAMATAAERALRRSR